MCNCCNEVYTIHDEVCRITYEACMWFPCVAGSERCFTKDSTKKADVFVYVEDDLGHTVSLLNLTTQTSDMVSLTLTFQIIV